MYVDRLHAPLDRLMNTHPPTLMQWPWSPTQTTRLWPGRVPRTFPHVPPPPQKNGCFLTSLRCSISILLTGDGLNNATLNASYSELTYTLYSISDMSTPIAEGFWTAYSDSLAATDAFIIDPASVQDGPVAIGLFRDVQVLLEPDASTPVAYLVHSLPDLHQSASRIGITSYPVRFN